MRLTVLVATLPRLTHLHAEGTSLSLSKAFVARELVTLSLSGAMDEATLEALSMSTIPGLVELTVTTPRTPSSPRSRRLVLARR